MKKLIPCLLLVSLMIGCKQLPKITITYDPKTDSVSVDASKAKSILNAYRSTNDTVIIKRHKIDTSN